MTITNSTPADIEEIFRLYRLAADYMRSKKTVVVWPEFDRKLVETELKENRQWKIVMDDKIACVWAVTFSDPEIWAEKNADPAVYIHRIATNPEFRGHNFVKLITEWAKQYAREQGKQFVRLDTLGNNVRLIELYKTAGFDFLGMFHMSDTSNLPLHYQSGEPACLFEIKLKDQ